MTKTKEKAKKSKKKEQKMKKHLEKSVNLLLNIRKLNKNKVEKILKGSIIEM